MSDIFGNLDNFLENYDEDDVASTSALNDSQDSIANDSLDSSRSDKARKRSPRRTKQQERGKVMLAAKDLKAAKAHHQPPQTVSLMWAILWTR